MTKGKIALITAIFTGITFVAPILVLLVFVSVNDYIGSVYVIVFGTLLFASFGFLFAMILKSKQELSEQLEELKIQNAAIAYKLSEMKKSTPVTQTQASKESDLSNSIPKQTKTSKPQEEKFDDFQ